MPPESRIRQALNRLGRSLGLAARDAAPEPGRAHAAGHSPLVAFHCGDGRDHAGRHHDVILAFDDDAMHGVHDFIQWLFPLPEPSRAFHGAPILSEEDLEIMRASAVCQARLAAAHARMTEFLTANPVWLQAYDHNHLRITRMIRSTRLIAGHEAADRLRDHFLHHARADGAPINPTTLAFWANA
jgi:hypothetical protein